MQRLEQQASVFHTRAPWLVLRHMLLLMLQSIPVGSRVLVCISQLFGQVRCLNGRPLLICSISDTPIDLLTNELSDTATNDVYLKGQNYESAPWEDKELFFLFERLFNVTERTL